MTDHDAGQQRPLHTRCPHGLARPPNSQTIYVTEGIGRCQRRGGPVAVIHPGERVFFAPGENHWHGAASDHFMTHLAMLDEQGTSAVWGEHVTDEEYGE